ncbi:hypothetical protein like AT4G00980 [Hibiscus trionum]|uniref:CCHC-type domain-containing protein n=1 Tax=Hibiscus trionum TaxID=183268 RepID=A0A9W7JBT3_HIBTR|nr:hypothetical protein like AT4G00980 [Hibiscus trionum]
MREEHLPFWMLMERVRVEESSRLRVKQAEHSKSASFHPAYNLGPKVKDMKKSGVPWKKQESEMHSKPLICNYCGRNDHISRFCHDRKCGKNVNGKQSGDNSTTFAVVEVNMIDNNV